MAGVTLHVRHVGPRPVGGEAGRAPEEAGGSAGAAQQRRGQRGLGTRGLGAEQLHRQAQVRDVRLAGLGRRRRVDHDLDKCVATKIFVKSIEHLELRVGELAVPVLVGEGEHLLDVVIRDTDRQVLHDVHKVGLGKVVAQYRAI